MMSMVAAFFGPVYLFIVVKISQMGLLIWVDSFIRPDSGFVVIF